MAAHEITCYRVPVFSIPSLFTSGVMPYLPYSKQSKMKKRGCITAKLVASMLAKAGMTHLITLDLYMKEIQGFFDFPVDNLRASPFLIQYIQENVSYISTVITWVSLSPNFVSNKYQIFTMPIKEAFFVSFFNSISDVHPWSLAKFSTVFENPHRLVCKFFPVFRGVTSWSAVTVICGFQTRYF